MKRILSLLLLLAMTTALLCGCSAPIIYDEEKEVNQWFNARIEGYSYLGGEKSCKLYNDKEGFIVDMRIASGGIPQPEVEYDPISVSVRETDLLTAWIGDKAYASASNAQRVFDPYQNQYLPSMQIYQKDAVTFRIFLWLWGGYTDFYPIPRLLSEEQYTNMKELMSAYHDEKYIESLNNDVEPVDYNALFLSAYTSTYKSDLVTNPNGVLFYEYTGAADEYLADFASVFARMELTQQNWRKTFEELGYKGSAQEYQIVYFDMVIGESAIDMTLKKSDAYLSPALKAQNNTFTYTFCTNLSQQKFINATQE
ncbi:MAG: hypothetical protein J6C26_00035 [Clostridia bacterium]|nr:hypothetical protein [Clostridia bacterium]